MDGYDLRVSSFIGSSSGMSGPNILPGAYLKWTVSIYHAWKNDFQRPSDPFYVYLYHDLPHPPTDADPPDDVVQFAPLEVGGYASYSFKLYDPAPGIYHGWIRIIPFKSWAMSGVNGYDPTTFEYDATNNIAGPILQPAPKSYANRADLAISSFSCSVVENAATYKVVVENEGNTDSGFVEVALYHDLPLSPEDSQPGGPPSQTQSVNVPAHGTVSVTFNRSSDFAMGGPDRSYVVLDRQNWIPELDENNNVAGPVYVQMGAPPSPPSFPPDLDVTGFSAQWGSYDAVTSSHEVLFYVTVANLSPSAAKSCYVDIFYDPASPPTSGQRGDDFFQIGELAGSLSGSGTENGTFTTITFYRRFVTDSSHTAYILVDPTAITGDFVPANNTASLLFTVPSAPMPEPPYSGADVVIERVRTRVKGDRVLTEISIANHGSQSSGPVKATVKNDMSSGAVNEERSIADIPAGATRTESFVRSDAVGSPSQSSTSVTSSAGEQDTAYFSQSPVPVVGGSDLIVWKFRAVVDGSTVTYYCTVKNNGDALAAGGELKLYYNVSGAQTADSLYATAYLANDYQWYVNMTGGQSRTYVFVRKNTPVGTYRSWVFLNPASVENVSNNVASITVKVK